MFLTNWVRTMSIEDTIYEYILIGEQIWLPPIQGGPPSLLAYGRNYMFKKHFKGFSNSMVTKESWDLLKTKHTVFKIAYRDMQ